MMKNLLIVFTVLAMASTATAALKISVNGQIDPPDTEITILPSDVVIIDVHNVGAPVLGTAVFFNVSGPATVDYSKSVNHFTGMPIFELPPGGGWFFADCAKADPEAEIPADFLVLDLIELHCEGEGDVVITIADNFGGMGTVFDTQVIHQIPEPITFALLGLGGLFLRRRK